MRVALIVPKTAEMKAAGIRIERTRLTWTTDHPASSYGLGVLKYRNGRILDGATFLCFRDLFGARIETTDPERVCRALGLPVGTSGIERAESGDKE